MEKHNSPLPYHQEQAIHIWCLGQNDNANIFPLSCSVLHCVRRMYKTRLIYVAPGPSKFEK